MLRLRLALLLATALVCLGCPKSDQTLVLIGGERLDAAAIDADPLGLLPSSAIAVGRLDAQALFATGFGHQVGQIVHQLLPIGPESGFVPARDVHRIYGAVYAMQGADFCAVLQGRFNPAAIEQAAQAKLRTPGGVPLVITPYAGYSIYTVANLGFVVLTPQTILSGNEVGMRRALDRLRYGKVKRDLPPWMSQLLDGNQPAFALGGDLSRQGVVQAVEGTLPFVRGMTMVRAIGNFQSPGMNIVGRIGYRDEESARAGAEGLTRMRDMGALLPLLGAQAPIMHAAQDGSDVAFATSLDTGLMHIVLAHVAGAFNPNAPSAWPF